MYDKYELEAMAYSRLKKLAIVKAKQNKQKSSWVQSSNKNALINFLLHDGAKVPKAEPKTTPTTTPTTTKSEQPKAGGLEELITDMVMSRVSDTIEEGIGDALLTTESELVDTFQEEVKKLADKVDKKIETLQRPVKCFINDVEIPEIEGLQHEKFPFVLKCLKIFKCVWLMGSSGTGKSYLIEQCAKALGFSKEDGTYEYLKGSAGVTESHMTGRMTFDGTFIDGAVARSFRNGTFLCLDEFDGFDANTGLVFNSVFDEQGILSTPNDRENPFVMKNENFHVAVASNTTGDGSDFSYVGRNQLDLATLDRLQAVKVNIDYDKNVERALTGEFTDLADVLWDLRTRCEDNSLKRIVSTRLFLQGQKWRLAGLTNAEFLDIITTDWTSQECDKINLSGLKGE